MNAASYPDADHSATSSPTTASTPLVPPLSLSCVTESRRPELSLSAITSGSPEFPPRIAYLGRARPWRRTEHLNRLDKKSFR